MGVHPRSSSLGRESTPNIVAAWPPDGMRACGPCAIARCVTTDNFALSVVVGVPTPPLPPSARLVRSIVVEWFPTGSTPASPERAEICTKDDAGLTMTVQCKDLRLKRKCTRRTTTTYQSAH